MSETRWTPGPWAVQKTQVLPTSRATTFEVVTDDWDVAAGCMGIRRAEDAHLIAAAPDLYAALEEIVRVWAIKGRYLDKAENALAKARGES